MANAFIQNRIENHELHSALIQAHVEGLHGICLTNTDPEADFIALVEKNRSTLKRHGLYMEDLIEKQSDNSIKIITLLCHKHSGQQQKSETILHNDAQGNSFEVTSPEVFELRRILHEGLLGLFSSNNAIEAELFGPKRKYRDYVTHAPTKVIEFEIFASNGEHKICKINRENFEREFCGMTSEEEAATTLTLFPYRELSWTDVKLFDQCPRCLYNAKKLVGFKLKDDSKGFALSNAVDHLLKKEFDKYRSSRKAHPIMEGTDIVRPLQHKKLDRWKKAYSPQDKMIYGIQYNNVWENWLVYGGVDDVWLNDKRELVIAEFKTIVIPNIKHLSGYQKKEHKKQVEFYAWLFRKNNYTVSPIGYLLYCNALTNVEDFNWTLNFEPHIIPIQIDDSWVQPKIIEILNCIKSDMPPESDAKCNTCKYWNALAKHLPET